MANDPSSERGNKGTKPMRVIAIKARLRLAAAAAMLVVMIASGFGVYGILHSNAGLIQSITRDQRRQVSAARGHDARRVAGQRAVRRENQERRPARHANQNQG